MTKTYYVNRHLIFNLESMDDKLWCLIYDLQDGKLSYPVEVINTLCHSEEDILTIKEECNALEWIAKNRKVTGKEYGRIKAISDWREGIRTLRCMANERK